jgi:hypothetical protein
VQGPLVELLARALVPGALLHIATDHEGYRDWIAEVMEKQSAFVNLHAPAAFIGTRPARRETAYEAAFRAEGRTMAYFDYRRAVRSLLARTPDELREDFAAAGRAGFRAAQVAHWLFARRERDFAAMVNLPRALRAELAREWDARALERIARCTWPATERARSCSAHATARASKPC